MCIELRRFQNRRLMKIDLGFKAPYFEIAVLFLNVCVW